MYDSSMYEVEITAVKKFRYLFGAISYMLSNINSSVCIINVHQIDHLHCLCWPQMKNDVFCAYFHERLIFPEDFGTFKNILAALLSENVLLHFICERLFARKNLFFMFSKTLWNWKSRNSCQVFSFWMFLSWFWRAIQV